MGGTVFTQFFWSDHSDDKGLKLCSLAAQGLWMRMLCVAADHEPIGFVAVGKRKLELADIATLGGVEPAQAEALLGELERNRVFSRDRKGCIYNRRMVRDAQRSAKNRKNGKKGGNPTIARGAVPKADRVRPFRRTDSPGRTRRIFEKSSGRCHWCNVELVWESEHLLPNLFHVDHVVAIRDGGDNADNNLVAACADCNHKRAKIDETVTPSKYGGNRADTNRDPKTVTNPQEPEAINQRDTRTLARDSVPRCGAPSEAERAERKRRWEARIFEELVRQHGPPEALRFEGAYQRGEPDAKRLYETIDQLLKKRRNRGKGA